MKKSLYFSPGPILKEIKSPLLQRPADDVPHAPLPGYPLEITANFESKML